MASDVCALAGEDWGYGADSGEENRSPGGYVVVLLVLMGGLSSRIGGEGGRIGWGARLTVAFAFANI